MEIRWLGNSTFEVKSSVGAVIVDHQGALPHHYTVVQKGLLSVVQPKLLTREDSV